MYETFYGLKEKPFQIVPDPSFLYRSEKHENALSYLEYGLNEQTGLVLLTGEVGSGKTTLIQYMLGRLNPNVESAVIFNSNLTSDQLLNMVLSEFDFEPPSDKTAALITLNDYLVRLYAEGRRALLIVDEAQNLSPSALEELRMLSNLHDGQHPLLQVVLVGQQELKVKLAQPAMRQLAQRIAVRYHLTGLNREDTGRYIAHRLAKAGGRSDLFTEAAVDLIFEISRGIPRAINLVCEAALVYGFAEESAFISQDIIRSIQKDQLDVGLVKERDISEIEGGLKDLSADRWESSLGQRLEAIEARLKNLEATLLERWEAIERFLADGQDAKALVEITRLWKEEQQRTKELTEKLSILEKEILPQARLPRKKRKRLREIKGAETSPAPVSGLKNISGGSKTTAMQRPH
ncbi:MAG: AAA family ATPase [candidate division WOR-3 bacterium]